MLQLNNIFQNNAVFQRGKAIPVWGRADAGAKIKAEFAGQSVFTNANSCGAFKMRFSAVEAGGPYTLKVTVCSTGESVTAENILVGDVWLASGQSNMQYPLGGDWAVPDASNPYGLNRKQEQEYKDGIKDPEKLRFIVVAQNASGVEEDSFDGEWKCMTAENAPECSAVAAWFGKYISEEIDVPVGLIVSAWGGTIAEAWTSRAGLLANSDTVDFTGKADLVNKNEKLWDFAEKQSTALVIPAEYADSGNEGFGKGWAECDFDDSSWKNMNVPGSWINQKVSGNGALWGRRTVELPAEWAGKELTLELGGIDKQDISYFNGVEIGRTGKDLETEWYAVQRSYKIPAELVKAGKNVIAVRAYSFIFDGSFNGDRGFYNLVLNESGEKLPVCGEWKAFAERDFGIIAGNTLRLGPGNPNTPSILFNGMIKPLLPYAIKGAIWYQGESNASNIEASASYLKKLETMVRDWYYAFEQGEFPFIQVQLAYLNRGIEEPCNIDSSWGLLRENQRLLCEKMENVHMASAIDIGDHFDIHPQDKKTVGYRLAQNALHNAYYRNEIVPAGPAYKKFIIENNKIRLIFENGCGMYVKTDLPQSFYIAGAEGKFYPATEVSVDGSSIVVSSDQVKFPKAVRYAWACDPVSSLYNAADLPASSFKTDD